MFGIDVTFPGARATRWCVCLIAFSSLTRSAAADWPQYRGPNHDGVSTERIRTNWSAAPPVQLWKVSVGPALSSLAVAGGRVLSQENRSSGGQAQEFTVARNADTGAELWAVPLGIADYASGGVPGGHDGPRSTPSIDGDRVYVLTSYLRLACLNATNGAIVWSHDLRTEYGGQLIPWENAASPLVVGDLVLVNGNGANERLLAFRKESGQLAWKGQNDAMTHATPVRGTIGGVEQVIFFAQSGLVSVVPGSGEVLWRYPVRYNGTSVAASPVVAGDLVYCSRAYAPNAGALVAHVTSGPTGLTATQFWYRTNQLMNHWSTPVQVGGYIYGLFGQGGIYFNCVDLSNGREMWPNSGVYGFGYGGLISVDGQLLVLSEGGELVLVAPNPQTYTEVGRFRAFGSGLCWNVPTISNGRIYARSTLEAVALDVALPPPPPLALEAALVEDETLGLRIRSSDGKALDAGRASRIEVLTASGLPSAGSEWTKLTNALVLTNGQLVTSEPISPSPTQRTYRARELP
jgi:outer membrane protein assembly factor BamB